MADPVLKTCTADTWIEVATNVTSAIIHKISTSPNIYKQTYVDTGNPAPADDSKAVAAFNGCDSFIHSTSAAADIYIKAVSANGLVRVDA